MPRKAETENRQGCSRSVPPPAATTVRSPARRRSSLCELVPGSQPQRLGRLPCRVRRSWPS